MSSIVAIVGTRRPTPAQLAWARRRAEEAVRAGYVVVTGAAAGIDQAAAEAALAAGGRVKLVLPERRFQQAWVEKVMEAYSGRVSVVVFDPAVHSEWLASVRRLHPNADALSDYVVRLHARNYGIVAGAERVYAAPRWDGDEPVGGTAQAVRVAQALGVPVVFDRDREEATAMKLVVPAGSAFRFVGGSIEMSAADALVVKRALRRPRRRVPGERSGRAVVVPVQFRAGHVGWLPIARSLVRFVQVGDMVRVVPAQGLLSFWYAIERAFDPTVKRKSERDRRRDARTAVRDAVDAFRKLRRSTEVTGVYGAGSTLPGLRMLTWQEFAASPACGVAHRRFARTLHALTGQYPLVAQVGITFAMAQRLASELGMQFSEFQRAVAGGYVLLVLRRNPLTDPITGFVVVQLHLVNAHGTGDVVWMPADASLALFGDQDGDRYYVDVVSFSRVPGRMKSRVPASLPVLDASLDGVGIGLMPLAAVKMSGLQAEPALAGVLAASVVGSLHTVVFRLLTALYVHGYRREVLSVGQPLLNVMEPIFDARKRLRQGAQERVGDVSVPVYSLPYSRYIVQALGESTLEGVRVQLESLANALLAEEDEESREVGAKVARAVSILKELPGDLSVMLQGCEPPKSVEDELVWAAGMQQWAVVGHVLPVRAGFAGQSAGQPAGQPSSMQWLDDRRRFAAVGYAALTGVRVAGSAPVQEIWRHALSLVLPDTPIPLMRNEEDAWKLRQRLADGRVVFRARRSVFERWRRSVVADLSSSGSWYADTEVFARCEGVPDVMSSLSASVFNPVLLEEEDTLFVLDGALFERAGGVVRVRWQQVDEDARKAGNAAAARQDRMYHVGVVTRRGKDGRMWYRFVLLSFMYGRVQGENLYTGSRFHKFFEVRVPVLATAWFAEEPAADVHVLALHDTPGGAARVLVERLDVVWTGSGWEVSVLTPQAQLLASLCAAAQYMDAGYRQRAYGGGSDVDGPDGDDSTLAPSSGASAGVGSSRVLPIPSVMNSLRLHARDVVRGLESSAFEVRSVHGMDTLKHLFLFGRLLEEACVFSGHAQVNPNLAIHRFGEEVRRMVARYGYTVWYPRKGGQNRVIALDLTSAEHWRELLAFGGQEWYRFVRETPGLMAVPARMAGRAEGIVQDVVFVVGDADYLRAQDGASETMYLMGVDMVEQERSQLVSLDGSLTGEFDELRGDLVATLEEVRAHGFEYVRGVGQLVSVDRVLEALADLSVPVLDALDSAGVMYHTRRYEVGFGVDEEAWNLSIQFWSVSRQRPAGAKVVFLDGMIKSFASVVEGALFVELGGQMRMVNVVASQLSLMKKQAWGILINGWLRAAGKSEAEIEAIWEQYRQALRARSSETEAMELVWSQVDIKPVPVYDAAGQVVGHAYAGIGKMVFIDDTSVRDDDPVDAGLNATTAFCARVAGVRYGNTLDVTQLEQIGALVFAGASALRLDEAPSLEALVAEGLVVPVLPGGNAGDEGGDAGEPLPPAPDEVAPDELEVEDADVAGSGGFVEAAVPTDTVGLEELLGSAASELSGSAGAAELSGSAPAELEVLPPEALVVEQSAPAGSVSLDELLGLVSGGGSSGDGAEQRLVSEPGVSEPGVSGSSASQRPDAAEYVDLVGSDGEAEAAFAEFEELPSSGVSLDELLAGVDVDFGFTLSDLTGGGEGASGDGAAESGAAEGDAASVAGREDGGRSGGSGSKGKRGPRLELNFYDPTPDWYEELPVEELLRIAAAESGGSDTCAGWVEDVGTVCGEVDATAQPEPQPEPEPRGEPEPQFEPQPEPEPRGEPAPEPEPEPQAEPEPEAEPQPEPGPQQAGASGLRGVVGKGCRLARAAGDAALLGVVGVVSVPFGVSRWLRGRR